MSDSSDTDLQPISPRQRPRQSPSQSEDDLAWDTFTEQPSFAQSSPKYHHPDQPPLLFGSFGDTHPTSVWPPRQLSSTDFHYLESVGLPVLPSLVPLGEADLAEEVFNSASPVDALIKKFNRTVRNWTQNYNRLKSSTVISDGDINDMKNKRSDAEDEPNDIFDELDENSDTYNEVLEKINNVRAEMSSLYQIHEKARQNVTDRIQSPSSVNSDQPSIQSPDVLTDREVTKLMSVLQHYSNELLKIFENLPEVNDPDILISKEMIDLSRAQLDSSKSVHNSAEAIYLKVIAEISVYESNYKSTAQRSKADQLRTKIIKYADEIKANSSKVLPSAPHKEQTQHSKSSIPLERLPLPKFSGRKTEYSRFKLDFE